MQNVAEKSRAFINAKVAKLQKLFLIEDAVESVKVRYIEMHFEILELDYLV